MRRARGCATGLLVEEVARSTRREGTLGALFPELRRELRDLRNALAGTPDAMDAGMRRFMMFLGSIAIAGCGSTQQGDPTQADPGPPPPPTVGDRDAGGGGASFDGALGDAAAQCTDNLIYLVGQDTQPYAGQGQPLLLYSYDPSTNVVHTIGTIPCATNWWWDGWAYDPNGWWGSSVPFAVDDRGFAWLVQGQGDYEAGSWSQTLLKVSTADASCIGAPVAISDSVHAMVGAALVPKTGGSGETLYVSAVVPPPPPDGGNPPQVDGTLLLGTLDASSGLVAGLTPVGGVQAYGYGYYYQGYWPGALAPAPNGHLFVEDAWIGTMPYVDWLYDVDPTNPAVAVSAGNLSTMNRWASALAYWKSDVYLFGWWFTGVWKFDPAKNTVTPLPAITQHWIAGASAGTCATSAPK
jgi:hypothetical protein